MIVTVEISHYPLQEVYEEDILGFVKDLKSNNKLTVLTNSMSTYLKGESQELFSHLATCLEKRGSAVSATIFKVVNRDLPIEEGYLKF